jgi:uncharacterized protein with HEPN domain
VTAAWTENPYTRCSHNRRGIEKIRRRAGCLDSADCFVNTPEGTEKLDAVAMRLLAIAGALKEVEALTEGTLFARHPEVDWTAFTAFPDAVARSSFDIDADRVFRMMRRMLPPLSAAVRAMIAETGGGFPP